MILQKKIKFLRVAQKVKKYQHRNEQNKNTPRLIGNSYLINRLILFLSKSIFR